MTEDLLRYVEISPVVMEGFPDAHNVFLRVWSQSFCVSPHGCETREEAEWMRDMLVRALTRIVQECTAAAALDADLSAIERAVLRGYEDQREPIGDSDLDNEQPVSLTVRMTLGELRRLHMQGFAQAARS